jgi:ribose transport system permease protein
MIQIDKNLKIVSKSEKNIKIKKVLSMSNFNKIFLPIAILFLSAVLSRISPFFFSMTNFMNLLLSVSVLAIVAVGESIVIIGSGIDISVGSIAAVTGILTGVLLRSNVNILLTIITILGIGLVIGFINGIAVANAGMNPFIVTLVGLTIYRGIAIAVTKGLGISSLPEKFNFIGSGHLWFIPLPVIIMLVIYVIAFFILEYTIFGRHVYALGESKRASFQAGLKVNKTQILTYMIAGLMAALGGIITTARLGSAQPLAANGLELQCIAAVVVGGTNLTGGRGTITGTLLGSILIGIIGNGLNLLNVSMYYAQIVYGLLVFSILLFDAISNKRYRIV